MALPIFPDLPTMAWNSKKRQIWEGVKVQKSGSGRRKSLRTQAYPEWEIECSYTCLDTEQIKKAAGFFAMVGGEFQPFLWKDPEDYFEEAVRIGTGTGSQSQFQLLKNLGGYYIEPVRDVVSGTLTVKVNGAAVSVLSENNGLVTVSPPAAGAVVTASFEYYWRVAFDGNSSEWENFWYNYYKLNKILVVTVR